MFSGKSALKNRRQKFAVGNVVSIERRKKRIQPTRRRLDTAKKNVCYAVCADRATAFQPPNRHGDTGTTRRRGAIDDRQRGYCTT